jgi:hypothetical protein
MAEEMDGAQAVPEEEGQTEAENIDERLKKLEKLEKLFAETTRTLEEERKASAGKDKKITTLQEEKKELQAQTLGKDDLLRLREEELREKQQEWEAKQKEEKAELEKLRIQNLKHEVLKTLPDFPSFLTDRVHGSTPEEIETDAREIMRAWVRERDKVGNARKVTKVKSGSGGKETITAEEVALMSPQDRLKWAATASDEEYDEVFDELHKVTE